MPGSVMNVAPYGSWMSPVKPGLLATAGVTLSGVQTAGRDVYWLEGRPLENGRVALVRRTPDGRFGDAVPSDFNVRTAVHEYGGGAYSVHPDILFFSHFADQRLYRLDAGAGAPRPITPEPAEPWALRYADGRVTTDGRWIVCVRERHQAAEVHNEIALLPVDGSDEPRTIAGGRDFYSDPYPAPDGRRLAWLCWDHPNMPWDGTELWVGDLSPDGRLSNARRVAGGPQESICQPRWSPEGVLHFISDRSGWWNLYRLDGERARALAPMEAELCAPQWVFGLSSYVFLPGGRLACIFSRDGLDHLGLLQPGGTGGGGMETLPIPWTSLGYLATDGQRLWLVGGSPTQGMSVLSVDPSTAEVQVIRPGVTHDIDPGYISIPRPVEFPTTGDRSAYALYYPPTNRDYRAPEGEKPPLLVTSHGGPTAATRALFSLNVQFWTSRGFGIVDVNYGGSSGYGRAYRERLRGQWGVVDVDDCIAAARYLVGQGLADGRRIAVRGGSAGGYTALCALTFRDFFAAGASYYGIADMEALVADTHKFESHYQDGLVGPYPEAKDLYYRRSPVHFAERISCPVILFQGLEDRVVPPSQAEMMVRALDARGLPHAYLTFEGEQHGFRKAENIVRCAEAELYFYSRVFGFELPEPVEPVEIRNLR